jgi:death-on-curing protein
MMNEPLFLTLDEVLQLHGYQIEHFGGDPRILNLGLLESAIDQPSAMFGGQFLHEDVAAMAAAYLFHIVQNHAFADGNKRTGTHAAIAFLEMNNVEAEYPVNEMEALTLGVAKSEVTKDQVIAFFRKLLAPTDNPS